MPSKYRITTDQGVYEVTVDDPKSSDPKLSDISGLPPIVNHSLKASADIISQFKQGNIAEGLHRAITTLGADSVPVVAASVVSGAIPLSAVAGMAALGGAGKLIAESVADHYKASQGGKDLAGDAGAALGGTLGSKVGPAIGEGLASTARFIEDNPALKPFLPNKLKFASKTFAKIADYVNRGWGGPPPPTPSEAPPVPPPPVAQSHFNQGPSPQIPPPTPPAPVTPQSHFNQGQGSAPPPPPPGTPQSHFNSGPLPQEAPPPPPTPQSHFNSGSTPPATPLPPVPQRHWTPPATSTNGPRAVTQPPVTPVSPVTPPPASGESIPVGTGRASAVMAKAADIIKSQDAKTSQFAHHLLANGAHPDDVQALANNPNLTPEAIKNLHTDVNEKYGKSYAMTRRSPKDFLTDVANAMRTSSTTSPVESPSPLPPMPKKTNPVAPADSPSPSANMAGGWSGTIPAASRVAGIRPGESVGYVGPKKMFSQTYHTVRDSQGNTYDLTPDELATLKGK